jgi:transmembrane sensor
MQADRTKEIDPATPVTEQASGWWVLLNEGDATEADHRAFAEWVRRSPERVSAYLQAAQVSQMLRSPRTPWPDTPVDELIGAAAASGVTRFPGGAVSAKPARGPTRRVPRLAVATLLAVVVAAIGLYFLQLRPERFETAFGEQRSFTLSDGSLVTLNTSSAIEVRFDKGQRRVALLAGEALFQVAHDTTRPFDVSAREVIVHAVGTQFNVDRHAPDTRIMVVEGRVEVSAGAAHVPLGAGEQMTLAPQGSPKVSSANVAAGTAWTKRELIFDNQPIGEIAAELNRYNRQVIDIQGEALRAEPVTGVFQSHDPESFLAFIGRIPGVIVEPSADGSRYIVRMSKQPRG